MSTPQEPPVFSKINQLKNSLNTIINGDYTTEQKDRAQQVLDKIGDYEDKFQTALDTFSDNISNQFSHFTTCKSFGINKATTLVNQLCSAMNTLASGAFLDELIGMTIDELVSHLDEHLSEVLDLLVNAKNSAVTFSSLINQTSNVLQTLFSDIAFLMSSLNDAASQVLQALNNCISFLRYNDSSVNSKFENLESISSISNTKDKIDRIKEIASTSFDNETGDISNAALNIIETLS